MPYVAEGQGFGMVVTAYLADHTAFDGLLAYVLAHPSVNNADLMAAEQDLTCKNINGGDSATDGDLDIAYALLVAHDQWGSAGTYNYLSLATKRINAIKKSEVNPTTHLMLLGDWATPDIGSLYYVSRTSDWMLDHFRAFQGWTGDADWATIRTAHQNLVKTLQSKYASSTGLLPDFVQDTNTSTPKPAQGEVLESEYDGAYYWNACRDPWRLGVDAVLYGDAQSTTAVQKMNTWIKSKTGSNPTKITAGYSLSGTALDSENNAAFFAPFAVAAMTASSSQAWLDALWSLMAATSIGSDAYYSGSILLQVMMLISGDYWVP